REVQHLGDGIMACFTAASSAVHCALEIRRGCLQASEAGPGPSLRIGMAAGEPVEQHQNLFGVTVEQARAIARAANPGEIFASAVVRELCAGKGLTFAPAAAVRIPGMDQPLPLASVVDPNGAARHAPASTDAEQRERLARALADRYRIERTLGQGGMATVYLARDLKHDRRVAIKVLRAELAALLGTERFLQEIRVAASLTHAHIVPLYDSGEADGILYYVMPHLEGQPLRALIEQEHQMSIDGAVDIAQRVAVALDYAHRQGVVHRDIKPENVLLHEGQPMVLDFGIALALSQAGGDRLTEPGLSVGTPAYMSPEQAAGDRDVDARTDVYALGCVLYEMLAGETPFTAGSVQAMVARILADVPTRLSRLRAGIPRHVEGAVHRALAKAPADRFASAAEFAEALRG
ncbi:MAG: protein kinase, partial [Gemmatimonadota bacterium]